MLALLKTMYNDAVLNVRSAQVKEGFAASIHLTEIKMQLNFTSFLLELPARIQQVQNQMNDQEAKVAHMKKAQEGGSI